MHDRSLASPRPPLRILLAEDNSITARAYAHALEDKGYAVMTADCLRTALALASGPVEFDLVISDIDLADGSGLDLMRLVRSRGNTPGIAISGYATRDVVRESAEAGFVVHLAKPVTTEILESAIKGAVCQHRTPSQEMCSASESCRDRYARFRPHQ